MTALSESIPWESFRPLLEQGYAQERKSNAGRKRIDPLILFKMLVLQQLFNLSDEELEFQVHDRRSFEEFIGLGMMNSIPDATTAAFFANGCAKPALLRSCSTGLKSTYEIRDWKPVVDRLSMQRLYLFPSREIPELSTKLSSKASCPRNGKTSQTACTKRTLTPAG